jgi:hypothetical protein
MWNLEIHCYKGGTLFIPTTCTSENITRRLSRNVFHKTDISSTSYMYVLLQQDVCEFYP